MASEPTKWEPSEASVKAAIEKYDAVNPYVLGSFEGDNDDAIEAALKAAVAADPLLGAAADMREALERCQKILSDLARPPENYASISSATIWAQCVEAEKKARDALAKAKGE